MHRLEGQYGDCIDFVYLDIDNPKTENVKRQLGYRVQPEFYALDAAGKVTWKQFGFITETDLETQLRTMSKK
ncbi:MAG: hypothetical protein HY327_10665 [Chloroflexi bacterium]|nr:hypothetical protein [Chloroflexota bacterium]